jgi:hypothetical protein
MMGDGKFFDMGKSSSSHLPCPHTVSLGRSCRKATHAGHAHGKSENKIRSAATIRRVP